MKPQGPTHRTVTSNVKLTMELCHPFRTQRILNGNSETLSSSLMERTNTEIFCPSSSDTSPVARRFHHIFISGSLPDVESARLLVRDHVPIEFVIGCRTDRVDSLGKNLLVAHFSSTFGVEIFFNLIAEDASYQVGIRGHRYRFDLLREAVDHFCHLTQIPSESVEMELAGSKLFVNLVRNCTKFLEKRTKARICCPVDGNSVLVRGSLEEVYFASETLTGITPIYLQFQPPPEIDIGRILKNASFLGISVSTGKNLASGCDEFIFSTFEWNIRHLYELWRISMGLQQTFEVLPKESPLCSNLVDLSQSFLSVSKNESGPTFESQCNEHVLDGHRKSNDTLNFRQLRSFTGLNQRFDFGDELVQTPIT